MKIFAVFALLVTLASGAFAHSPVESTTPSDGGVTAAVPAEINLRFVNKIRLTRVDMFHQDHPSVRLDLGDQTRFDHMFTLPLQGMGPGTYRIEWRGLGADGHAMQGEFSFTVE